MIQRHIITKLTDMLVPGQAVILYGARRVGKTTLIRQMVSQINGSIKSINAENSLERANIETKDFYKLKTALANTAYVFIDEAQTIPNIGETLKIIVDTMPHIKILASGSASFELANKVGEPLTGRKRTFTLYPFALEETHQSKSYPPLSQIEEYMIYGSYPKVFLTSDYHEKKEELFEIVDSYLYKDILELEEVKNAQKIRDLLVLLALQLGSEVSLNELANSLSLHVSTVARYLDLLEKVFVIYRLGGFSRNLRKEVNKSAKYYFFDNGIRNALLNNFNTLNLRNDAGPLWENYIMGERLKHLRNNRIFANRYFWRTWDQKEIDLVEERDGMLYGYECKWGNKIPKPPNDWIETYENARYQVVNPDNYIDFVT